jgi:DNA transformation protein
MTKLRELKGLGPKSEQQLVDVGVCTVEELRALGAVRTFIRLRERSVVKPSLNFLYALVGALEGEHWLNIAKTEKGRLLMELDGYDELQRLLDSRVL